MVGYATKAPGTYNVVVECEQLAAVGATTGTLDNMIVWQGENEQSIMPFQLDAKTRPIGRDVILRHNRQGEIVAVPSCVACLEVVAVAGKNRLDTITPE